MVHAACRSESRPFAMAWNDSVSPVEPASRELDGVGQLAPSRSSRAGMGTT